MGPNEARKVAAKCKKLSEARDEITQLNFSSDAYMLKDTLIFYYNGLKYLEANFPFEPQIKKGPKVEALDDYVHIQFTWKDSVTGVEYTSKGLQLELNSVLFNLGVVLSNCGSRKPLTKDSIK